MSMIQEGEARFAAGDLSGARAAFEAHLRDHPGDPDAESNLAVVDHVEGRVIEAERRLWGILEAHPTHAATLQNLGLALGPGQAARLLPHLARGLAAPGAEEALGPQILALASGGARRKRVAFFCIPNGETFIKGIAEDLKAVYDTRLIVTRDLADLEEPTAWADVIWLEWGDHLAVEFTKRPRPPGKRVICRVHSWEAVDGVVRGVTWSRVDQVIFVAPHIQAITEDLVPDLKRQLKGRYLVPNGVDLDRFAFIDRPRGKRLAYLGYINHKKGPMLLLHAFSALVAEDPEYELHIGGRFQDARYHLYLQQMLGPLGLEGRVTFHGWIDDPARWLADKHYIVCSSVLEGHPVGLTEGMARGLKPLIHEFVGAGGVFPRALRWRTIPEFVRLVREGDYAPSAYRGFVASHYGLAKQLLALMAIIEVEPAALPTLNLMPPPEALEPR
ncbi:glycosyltransferase [Myxococcota bacterium]|nr:glycosyltransferase [Myxococcota bacterium]MBU1898350.1 glycosyltransferase [Myxococcota bacterium]